MTSTKKILSILQIPLRNYQNRHQNLILYRAEGLFFLISKAHCKSGAEVGYKRQAGRVAKTDKCMEQ